MRRRAALAAVGVLLLAAAARLADGQGGAARELAPGIYFWQGDRGRQMQANCGWVVFRDYVLVIDANFPWGARAILPEIRRTTGKPVRFLFDTHYHSDHTFGNSVLAEAGATMVCSADCAAEMRARSRSEWDAFQPTDPDNRPLRGPEYTLAPYRLEFPSLSFPESLVFDDGTRRVEITKLGPAHTLGDAVAYLPREKILFTGDLCVNWTRGNNVSDPRADPANWLRVLEALERWEVTAVVPGHGALGTPETLRAQRAYLAEAWERVQAGVRDGRTVEQIIAATDLSRHRPFGAEARFNAGAIRGMYRQAARR